MIKVIALVLTVIIAVVVLGSIGIVGVKTANYMIHQNFNFGEAIKWAFQDYTEWLSTIFVSAEALDERIEFEMTNKNIDVVACTAL